MILCMMSDLKNVLILHAHDMGRYNSAYGHATPTPRMEALAGEGMLFRQAHCAAPTCSPSRAALLTGRTAHEAGVEGLIHRGWDMADYDAHLAAHLGRAGLHTAWAGVQHEFADEAKAPYAEHIESPHHGPWGRDASAATAAADWLRQPKDQPFFLWTGFFLPHLPFVPADPKRFPAERMQPPAALPDTAETRQDWADYCASVERTDDCVGLVLDALREGGHAEDTLVILTTDHGVPLPHMKCHLTGHGTGVTLAMRAPGIAKPGAATDALVSHMDVFPTICELLGVETPSGLHGRSLLPLLSGKEPSVRDDVFAEINYHASYQPARSVRTKRWNYIRSFDTDRRRPLANCDESRSKTVMLDDGWAERETAPEELYDLIFDPQEVHNLAADPAYAAVREDMAQRLEQWLDKTNDPIRHGAIPLLAGAKCNTRESLHPGDGPFCDS